MKLVGRLAEALESNLIPAKKSLSPVRLANGFAGWVALAALADTNCHSGRQTFVHLSCVKGRRNTMTFCRVLSFDMSDRS